MSPTANPIRFHSSVALLLGTLLATLTPQLQAEPLRLAVAANFVDVCREIAAEFSQQYGYQSRISFGSTGKLYAQIMHGAPFDILLAADAARPQRLVEQGMAVEASRFTYARGRLTLWSAKPGQFDDGEEALRRGNFDRLAMANPETAPYGLAARQTLQHLGLWQTLERKVVQGESIAQAFQFTASGNALLGLVARSQFKSWPAAGSLWLVPEGYHQPIRQQAVLLTQGADKPSATTFLQFLQSAGIKQLIRRHGYGVD